MINSFVKHEIIVVFSCLSIFWGCLLFPITFTSFNFAFELLMQPFMLYPYGITILAIGYCIFVYRRFK